MSGTTDVLTVEHLTVTFDVDGEVVRAVDDASFTVARGEVVAVVGESGSGKSMTAMTAMGIAPDGARASGSIRLGDLEVIGADERTLRSVRGRSVSMVFQDPSAALNPVFTIGFQLAEAVRRTDGPHDRAAVRERSLELLRAVEVPEPERRLGQYPHELSGGQAQRVMIAMALAAGPDLLIADEPTTALDVTVQAEVLDVLRALRERTGTAILLITHDMGVVADLADRVVVMRRGRVVETGTAEAVFAAPSAEYTRELLAAVPRMGTGSGLEARLGSATEPCGAGSVPSTTCRSPSAVARSSAWWGSPAAARPPSAGPRSASRRSPRARWSSRAPTSPAHDEPPDGRCASMSAWCSRTRSGRSTPGTPSGRPSPSRSARSSGCRRCRSRNGSSGSSPTSVSTACTPSATRTNSPAANGNASRSPARWRSTPRS